MFIPYKIEEEQEYTGKPILIYILLALCIGVHFYLYDYTSEFFRNNVFYEFGCVPVDFHWWTALTCTFLHGGILHLAGNMYFLWIYGRTCEKALGSCKFALLYIIGAFVSVWAHVISVSWFYQDVPTIGASGAISAVLGAFLVLFPKTKVKLLVTTFGRPLPTFAPAAFVLGFWFLMQIVYSLQLVGEVAEVAFWAHIGGFAVGSLIGGIYLWLHNFSQKRNERGKANILTQAWHTYGDGGDPLPFLQNLPEGEWQKPERYRELHVNILAGVVEKDSETAFNLLHTEMMRAVDFKDHGRALFCYYYLVNHFSEWGLDAYTHRLGLSMAVKMNSIKLMAHAYRHLLAFPEVETPDRLLCAMANCLKRNGYIQEAASVANNLRHYFPGSHFANNCDA
jgi:rhomboid family protein